MRQLEVNDILAAVTWFKDPGSHFNITDFVSFNQNSTRAGAHRKLCHYHSNSRGTNSFYFRRLPRLWNALPPIDLDKPLSAIKVSIIEFMYKDFITSFVSSNPCTFHIRCHALNAPTSLQHLPLTKLTLDNIFNHFQGCPKTSGQTLSAPLSCLSFYLCTLCNFNDTVK